MRRSLFVVCLIVGSLSLASRPAAAQDGSLETARVAFEKGQALFEAGNFGEAAVQFESARSSRPFPQFLFNIGACHEKLADYPKAVDFYKQYVAASPTAPDRKKTEKRIAALEKAIAELAAATPPVVDPANPDAPPPAAEPPQALVGLDAAAIKGVVVIESDPPNANIYLDNKKGRPFTKTPWNGELSGEHTIFLEREGYKPVERRIAPAGDKFLEVIFVLAEEDYLGWIDITSNVEQADIYIDDRAAGVRNKTPWGGNMTPGKHTIWVTKEGYDEYQTEIDIVRGKPHTVTAKLAGAPVGYVNIRGRGIERTQTFLDGKKICDGACIKAVPQGEHEVTVKREGFKPYSTSIEVQAKTETTVRAQLAEKPARVDAIVAYVFAGAFIGAGVWAGQKAGALEDELQKEIDAGAPPPDADDGRFTRGKIYAIGADAAYVLGGASLLAAVYYTFRDKGAPSTGTTDVRAVQASRLRWSPEAAPGYAGVGMEVRW